MRADLVLAGLGAPAWAEAGVGPVGKAGWARAAGPGRSGLGGAFAVELTRGVSVFSARRPAYPQPFPDSVSAGPWEGLCPRLTCPHSTLEGTRTPCPHT